MKRLIAFVWKSIVGVALCLTPVTAVLVIGWVGRVMQRSAFKIWFRENDALQNASSFSEFMLSSDETAHLASWPNWIAGRATAGAGNRFSRVVSRLFGSFWSNLKLGLQMLLNTWVLTLPAGLIWVMAWWGGWENSFNKGYEQAAVGPLVGMAGVVIFLAAMLYVPLAQARQAATGNWRAFYDFRMVRLLIRHSRWLLIWLAVFFAISGLVMSGIHVGPLALGNILDGNAPLSEPDVRQIAGVYKVSAGAVIFVLVIGLRTAAARIYARALSRGVQAGDIGPEMLAVNERAFFARLGLLDLETKPAGGLVKRTIVTSGRGIAGIATASALLAIWFIFVAQLFVSQFLNHSWVGWLNLPLVQIPWFYGP